MMDSHKQYETGSDVDRDRLSAFLSVTKNSQPFTFYDLSLLPTNKDDMARIIISAISNNIAEEDKKFLRLKLLTLAQFQEDVGPIPFTHPLLSERKNLRIEEITALLQTDYKGFDKNKFDELNTAYVEEANFYSHSMIMSVEGIQGTARRVLNDSFDKVCVLIFICFIMYALFFH